jgi:hypothetical protein
MFRRFKRSDGILQKRIKEIKKKETASPLSLVEKFFNLIMKYVNDKINIDSFKGCDPWMFWVTRHYFKDQIIKPFAKLAASFLTKDKSCVSVTNSLDWSYRTECCTTKHL